MCIHWLISSKGKQMAVTTLYFICVNRISTVMEAEDIGRRLMDTRQMSYHSWILICIVHKKSYQQQTAWFIFLVANFYFSSVEKRQSWTYT